MDSLKPTMLRLHPAMGRGGGGGGARGGFSGHPEGDHWGVFVNRAPFQNGACGPNEAVSEVGTCEPIVGMGQTGALVPAGTPMSVWLARAAAAAGVAGTITQMTTKEGSRIHMIGGYAEMAAIATLAGLVLAGKIV